MHVTTHGLEQRIKHLQGRLQMFGDMPALSEERSVGVLFFSLKGRLPGFGLQPEIGQVRLAERWRRSGDGWRLSAYVYEYQRDALNPCGPGTFGYHLHAMTEVDPSGRAVPHAKVEDGSASDPHYQHGAVSVDDAIDAFFLLDASGGPISPRGLDPLFPRRR